MLGDVDKGVLEFIKPCCGAFFTAATPKSSTTWKCLGRTKMPVSTLNTETKLQSV